MKSEDPEKLRKIADYLDKENINLHLRGVGAEGSDLIRIAEKLERIEKNFCLDFLLGGE